MPTNERIKTFATGIGAYTGMGVQQWVATQGSSAAATYNLSIGYVMPYVAGLFPGRAQSSKPYSGATAGSYGIVRAVYLTTITTMSGVGAAGAGGTASLRLYRAAASAVTVATLAFDNGTDATALTPKLITLSTTAANLYVRFGDLLVFRWAQGGTGLALPECLVSVDLI